MEIDPELIVNKDKLNSVGEILNCVICSNILFQPMTCIYCENSFCKECLIKWENKNKICPLCKKELKTKESRIIKNLLSDLIIKCEKCNKNINYNDFKNHQILCGKSNNNFNNNNTNDDDDDFDLPPGVKSVDKSEKIVIENGKKKKVIKIVKHMEDGSTETEINKETID